MIKFLRSDFAFHLRRSPVALASLLILLSIVFTGTFASWLSPYDPFDLTNLNLMDSLLPPAFLADGNANFFLGTDDQGRDILSGIIHGLRISLVIGILSMILALVIGIGVGLVAGYAGGRTDAVLMRVADVQLTFPAIFIALMIDGLMRAVLTSEARQDAEITVLVFAIGVSLWPQFARTVRGSCMIERNREYVQAAHVIGLSPSRIMLRHILPNIMGPVVVLATLNLGIAIVSEATLSYLGVGLPPTTPSLGTLIRIGNNFLFSGSWWIALFPMGALAILVLAINLLGDWLRDVTNHRLSEG
jgi:peptide/nickel transport system permease protein